MQLYIEPTYGGNNGSDEETDQITALSDQLSTKVDTDGGEASELKIVSGYVGNDNTNIIIGQNDADARYLNISNDTANNLRVESGSISPNVIVSDVENNELVDSNNTIIGQTDLQEALSQLEGRIISESESETDLSKPFSVLATETEVTAKLDKNDGIATNLTVNSGNISSNVLVDGTTGNNIVGKKVNDLENYYTKTTADSTFLDVDNDTATRLKVQTGAVYGNVKLNSTDGTDGIEVNKYIYADNNGETVGNIQLTVDYATEAGTATKAIKDQNNNVIDTTYATKAEVPTTVAELTDSNDYAKQTDISSFITKDVNNLTNYTLSTGVGTAIDLDLNTSNYKLTMQLKNSQSTTLSTATVDLPLSSVVVSGSYNNSTQKVTLELQGGSRVEFSIADLISGLQNEITSSNKLSSDLVDDTNHTNKFVTASDITNWNGKQNALGFTPYNSTNPNGFTKVESSSTNGNVKIDNVETTVYTLPNDVVKSTDLGDQVTYSLSGTVLTITPKSNN